MYLTELNDKIIRIGDGLIARIKYEFGFAYDHYGFLKMRHEKQQKLEAKTHKSLYKKK